MAAIFAFDLAMPLGFAGAELHVIVVLLGITVVRDRSVIMIASVCTGLILAGYFFLLEPMPPIG